MNNKEFFANYGTERWAIEQNLCYMLQEYWEMVRENTSEGKNLSMKLPINPVSFVKEFMKKETLIDIKYAEQSKMDTLKKNEIFIDVEYQDVTEDEKKVVGFSLDELEEPKNLFKNQIMEQTGTLDFNKLVWPGE